MLRYPLRMAFPVSFHRLSELVSLFATIMLSGACGGRYKYEGRSYAGPGRKVQKSHGRDRSRSVRRAILIAACAIISGVDS